MLTLVKKEIGSFFSSLTGYVVVGVFLVVSGLFIWVFPGELNIPDSGYATLDTLFIIAPWVFLFLVPAVTMRMFAEERRSGTIELLHVRPLSDLKIVAAKFLAAVILILISLLPTLVWYWSVHSLGNPQGNLDTGAIWGSYIGLVFLASCYASIGLFASSLTDNQIVAFIVTVLLCFFFFIGFEMISALPLPPRAEELMLHLGINEHYRSVSRGVVDTRDIVYFLSLIVFFVYLTGTVLEGRKKKQFARPGFLLAGLVLAGILSGHVFARADLTSDRRYTLSGTTRDMLEGLDDVVHVRVYLDGDLPAGFRRMRNATRELLDEFRVIAGYRLQYEFIDPSDIDDPDVRNDLYRELHDKGLNPTNIEIAERGGGRSQKLVFPGAILSYDGFEMPVNLLRNNPALQAEQNLNNSIQGLEYEFVSALYSITDPGAKKVAFIEGHGELDEMLVAGASDAMARYYDIYRGRIDTSDPGSLDDYDAIIIAKPLRPFTEPEKYIVDQYIMNGGRVMWFIDPVSIDLDSLTYQSEAIALINDLNLDDMLFRYGVRLNPNLIMDANCLLIPVNVALAGEQARFMPAPWYFSPLLAGNDMHPVTRGLNYVKAEFASVIDTVGTDRGISREVLLRSSPATRVVNAPMLVSLDMAQEEPRSSDFNMAHQPVAVLLEGEFRSVFANRVIRGIIGTDDPGFREQGEKTRMLVVSDGDIIRNDVTVSGGVPEPLPLGYDRYSGQTFGNSEFVVNALNYVLDEHGLMELRTRELQLRLLDRRRVREQRLTWQVVNLGVPFALIVISGLIFNSIRKRLYATR